MGTGESGLFSEVAIVERFKQESMYGLSAEKRGLFSKVTIVERFKQESVYGLSAQKVAFLAMWPL